MIDVNDGKDALLILHCRVDAICASISCRVNNQLPPTLKNGKRRVAPLSAAAAAEAADRPEAANSWDMSLHQGFVR